MPLREAGDIRENCLIGCVIESNISTHDSHFCSLRRSDHPPLQFDLKSFINEWAKMYEIILFSIFQGDKQKNRLLLEVLPEVKCNNCSIQTNDTNSLMTCAYI